MKNDTSVVVLFGKPYIWVRNADKQLSLIPFPEFMENELASSLEQVAEKKLKADPQ